MNIITRKRGDDYSIFLDLKDGNKQPLDITGASFVLSTSRDNEPGTADYVFQIAGVIFGVATDGVVEFPFTGVEADNIGKMYYDVSMLDAGGKTRTVKDGVMIFKQDIGK